jgi:hypothetical protein
MDGLAIERGQQARTGAGALAAIAAAPAEDDVRRHRGRDDRQRDHATSAHFDHGPVTRDATEPSPAR